jgi:hypothetical protein
MIKRLIFQKKKSYKKKIIFYFFILFLFLIFYILYNNENNSNLIIIPENKNNFYSIPKDRGGEKVANLDKKSLNLKSQSVFDTSIVKPANLLFSLQFYSSNVLTEVSEYLKDITYYNESNYQVEEFHILALNSELGVDYFLLYKNFKTKKEAKDYCLKFVNKIDKCLIVDTTKF